MMRQSEAGKEPFMAQPPVSSPSQEQRVEEFVASYQALRSEVGKIIVGHHDVVGHVLIGLFAGGHVLLEGVPGLGKTLLIKTLAESLDLSFSRIQFTPDLMPGDIIGTNIIVEDAQARKHFQFQRGPIFGHILLADEVNRATPKTQSALLEGMQEGAVTVSGAGHPLPAPFFVLATHPQWERAPEATRRFVRYGASPRGAQALVLGAKVRALADGRFNVSVEDLRSLALPALRHRLILNFEGEAEGVDVDDLIGQIVQTAEAMSGSEKEVFLR